MDANSRPVFPKHAKHHKGHAAVTISGKDHYIGPRSAKAKELRCDRLILEWLATGRPVAQQ